MTTKQFQRQTRRAPLTPIPRYHVQQMPGHRSENENLRGIFNENRIPDSLPFGSSEKQMKTKPLHSGCAEPTLMHCPRLLHVRNGNVDTNHNEVPRPGCLTCCHARVHGAACRILITAGAMRGRLAAIQGQSKNLCLEICPGADVPRSACWQVLTLNVIHETWPEPISIGLRSAHAPKAGLPCFQGPCAVGHVDVPQHVHVHGVVSMPDQGCQGRRAQVCSWGPHSRCKGRRALGSRCKKRRAPGNRCRKRSIADLFPATHQLIRGVGICARAISCVASRLGSNVRTLHDKQCAR